MSSIFVNASNLYQVRPKSAQFVSSTHKNSSASAVKFGNNKAYYRELDPKLTEHQVTAYADAEVRWREVVRNVETAQGTNILGILRAKTQGEFRALKTALNAIPNVMVDEGRPEEAADNDLGPHTAAYTNRRGDGKVMIHTYVDFANPAMANDNFLTLAHEGIHALHILAGNSIEPSRDENIVSELDKIEGIIDRAVSANLVPHNKNSWKQLFRSDSDLVSNLRQAYDIDDLKKIKPDLISEAVAYNKSAYIGETQADREHELNKEAGYTAAVSFINDLIDEKTIELQHPPSPPRLGSPAGWKYSDDMRQKQYKYQNGQRSQWEPTRPDSPAGWKYSVGHLWRHYKFPNGQRSQWEPNA